jgi:hypothetical protein
MQAVLLGGYHSPTQLTESLVVTQPAIATFSFHAQKNPKRKRRQDSQRYAARRSINQI